MALNGSEGSLISRKDARQLMDNYLNSPAFPANNQTLGILFGKDHFDHIFAQPGCKGVRIYFGKSGESSTDDTHLVIVGTDNDGNDITNSILDAGIPCPSLCSTESI